MRKQILVKIPEEEQAAVADVLARYPGFTPQLIIRALLLTSPRIGIDQAVAKHLQLRLKGWTIDEEKK